MGLDATVRCGCWEKGTTSACPVPRDAVKLDDDDQLVLNLSWEHNQDAYARFEDWLEECCPHPQMTLAHQRISTWSGIRKLQHALSVLGETRCPTLLAELPGVNGGRTSPEAAARCLKELDAFEQIAKLGDAVKLVDEDTGWAIYDHIEVYDGVFAWLGAEGIEIGIDTAGFFVRAEDGTELFRAEAFEQVQSDGMFTYRDRASQRTYTCRHGISYPHRTRDAWVYPRQLVVKTVHDTAQNYAHELAALRAVFEASVASGRPVVWC